MAEQLRFAVLGSGMMGQEHMRNLVLFDGNSVSALCDPDEGMRNSAHALAPEARVVSNIDALCAVQDFDAILIASPNFLHVPNLTDLQNKLKTPVPIMIEKPLYTDPADEAVMQEFAKTYPAMVWVGMEYRYMAPIAALIDQANEITGGVKMLTIREHRFPFLEKVEDWNRFNEKSGGTFVEKCCHFFDLMRLIMGCEPTRIVASAGQDYNHLDEVYDGKRSDIMDAGYVLVDFENGSRALLELCMYAEGSRWQEEISAVGAKGKIECFLPGPLRLWPESAGAHPTPKLVISPRHPAGASELEMPVDSTLAKVGDHHGSTYVQHRLFRQAVLGGGKPEVTIADGVKAVKMGQAAQESAISKRIVQL